MMRLQNARILDPSSLDPANEPIAFDAISDALGAIRNGECVVVVDDEQRENEGDLILSLIHI